MTSGLDWGLRALDVLDFRNIAKAHFDTDSHLNVVTGANASGKTSVLEAIYFLGRGRSFRSSNLRDLVRRDQSAFRIVVTIDSGRGSEVVAGLERGPDHFDARAAGRPVRSQAELAKWLPVLLLTPDSHRLLDAGPRHRRRFLDWGCFHRDEGFLEGWRRYQRALRHRNAALRSHAPANLVRAWDPELAAAGQEVHRVRQSYMADLEQRLIPLASGLMQRADLLLSYQRGWSTVPELLQALEFSFDRDRQLGFTRVGPHRADFTVQLENRRVAGRISRGQQKMLILALTMAQAELFRERTGRRCLLLVDDLPAELDSENRQRVLTALSSQAVQCFVTSIDIDLMAVGEWRGAHRFHLRNGELGDIQ